MKVFCRAPTNGALMCDRALVWGCHLPWVQQYIIRMRMVSRQNLEGKSRNRAWIFCPFTQTASETATGGLFTAQPPLPQAAPKIPAPNSRMASWQVQGVERCWVCK